jgi:DNA topoisomerase-1
METESQLNREKSHDEIQKEKLMGIEKRDDNKYYYLKTDKEVSNKDLTRINKLRIPPAWINVWVSTDPDTPIQAVGVDAKGRKQYRYNDAHIEQAEKEKFVRLYNFIISMPKLEKALKTHSKLNAYSKDKVVSTMLFLVKTLYIRVGKEQYARENRSYGISSLKKKHVNIDGNMIKLRFKGKSNQRLSYNYTDPVISQHLKQLIKLAGDKLFQYIDEETGEIRKVTDTDLNQYVQRWMGKQFTVKDFRTYAANHHFIKELLKVSKKYTTEKKVKKDILKAIKKTAQALRHTKAISKKSYVMSFAIDLFKQNQFYFYKNKHEDPDAVLLAILKLYKKEILHI